MKLYNSLTKKLEKFTPLSNTISIYSCGPTVYNSLHIGNLSAFIYADILRRTLEVSYPEHKVTHVMNITDVDDKTIRDSTGLHDDPMVALTELTRKYEQVFMDDMQAIGNDINRIQFIRATESIEDMQCIIKDLFGSGYAYNADDGVYFSIEKYRASGKTYGQLVHIDGASTSSSRIQNDEYDKKSAHDFALWKVAKDDEPYWQFELGGQKLDGRPGWHIECSAMSRKLLGQPFDIHTGGIDLKFPHHENEIAQSTACSSDPTMARFFLHNEHVLVDGKKMSKSLNNFYTLRDLENKGYEPMAFRMLVLQGHYRNSVSFSWDNLDAAQNRLNNWRKASVLIWQEEVLKSSPPKYTDTDVRAGIRQFIVAYESDLDTGGMLATIDAVFRHIEAHMSLDSVESLKSLLNMAEKTLGIKFVAEDINHKQKELLAKRAIARKNSDFVESDKLRDLLKESGVQVLDTAHGQIWHYL